MRKRIVIGMVLVALIISWFGSTPVQATPDSRVGDSVRVIVELEKAPLLGSQEVALMSMGNRMDVNSPAAQAYIQELKSDQVALARTASRAVPGAKMAQYIDEDGNTNDLGYQIAFNGFTLKVPNDSRDTILKLMQLPGVKMVHPVQEYELDMDASLPLIGLGDPAADTVVTDGLWDALGGPENAGDGLKVAVLDTGIDINHDFFDPTGFSYPAGYPKGNAAYTTPKVIVSRAYYRADDPPVFDDPLDHSGHGSHTSGTIAGNYGVTATVGTHEQVVSGIAPRAHLMNYQVFYQAMSGSESAYNAELLRALDDLVLDGADVTNNSWGGPDNLLAHADPIVQAFQNIIDNDIVAVKSAGNAGRGQGSADPAGPDDILLVGATTTTRGFGNRLDVTAPSATIPPTVTQILATEAAFTPAITETFGPETYVYVGRLEPSNFEGCSPFGADAAAKISGNVALISRGACAFVDKVANAYDAGAVGAVVFNNVKGAPPIVMGGDPTPKTVIPAFMVGNEPGKSLAEWEIANPGDAKLKIGVDIARIENAKPADIIGDFSASGPDIALNIKPDLVAPGVDILSSVNGNEWSLYQGTSMAAPHVAGAAVLLRDLYPTWSVDEIKSALMTTAKVDGLYNDYSQTDPAGAMDRGAGRIDLVAAGDPGIVVDMPSLSFGEMEPGEVMTYTVTATNVYTTVANTYTTAISETGDMTTTMNFTLTAKPDTIDIDDAGDDTVDVVMEIPADAEPGDYEGLVWLRHGTHDAHIPVWVRVVPPQTVADVLLIDDDFSAFGFPDYAGVYTRTLEALGVSYATWDTDVNWYFATGDTGGLPDVATLQRFDSIIWFTGDSYYSYLNYGAMVDDRWAMLDFLRSSGGKLAVFGQDFSGYQLSGDTDVPYLPAIGLAADVTPGTEDTFDLATGVPGADARGLLNSPFKDVYLDFSGSNQVYVDELLPQGKNAQGADYGGEAAMEALVPGAVEKGIVGVIRHMEPTLENEGVFDSPDYRTAYMSFGLEGINEAESSVTQTDLMERVHAWLMDEVAVEIQEGAGGAVNTVIALEAEATSSVGADFTQFRWDFGDGTPVGTTTDGDVYHLFTEPGIYTVTVEATDTYGHKALDTAQIAVNGGVNGSSTNNAGAMTMAGDEVKQTVVMVSTVNTPTTGLMVNPLPANTEYVTHTGGTWVDSSQVIGTPGGATLTLENSLYLMNTFTSAGEAVTMTLTYRILPGTSANTDIVNTSQFWVGDNNDYFERETTIDLWGKLFFPIVMKQ